MARNYNVRCERYHDALEYIASWPTWGWDFNARAADIRSYAQAVLAGQDPLVAAQKARPAVRVVPPINYGTAVPEPRRSDHPAEPEAPSVWEAICEGRA